MRTPLSVRAWLRPLVTSVVMTALLSGCGDAATQDCEDCPNPALQPACEAAAQECDAVPSDEQQTCIDEARALCA